MPEPSAHGVARLIVFRYMGQGVANQTDRAHVRLAELVAALSLGIDLGFGQPMEHVLRQCLIALRLAEGIGLDEQQRAAVYYTSLLVNVGCHSDAHEQAKWFGDDIAMKAIKYDHEPRSLRMAAAGVRFLGSGHPPLHRFRLGLEFLISGHREVDNMVAHHAAIARTLGEQLGLPAEVLEALDAAYERWDGRGWPGELEGEDVPVASRLAQVAEFVEVANRMGGVEAARDLVRERRGEQFDPALADLMDAEADVILSGLDTIGTWDAVIQAEPALAVVLTGERFEAALLAIANFVDLKSPYFLGHARAVADLAAEAGARLGLAEGEVRTLRRAGLVHDLGRLGVSNAIWDKPGPLGAGEWERVRLHPYLTKRMLRQSQALAPLAEIPSSTASASTARAIHAGCPARGSHARRESSGPPTPTRRFVSPVPTAPHAQPTRPPPSCGPTSRPAAATPRPSRRFSARPAIASRGATRVPRD